MFVSPLFRPPPPPPPAATLNILPNRCQFFNYDRFALTCVAPARSSAWTLWRNTSWRTFEACNASWGLSQRSDCTIEDAYEADSGVYWCQSEHGECSNTVSVAVTSNGLFFLKHPDPVLGFKRRLGPPHGP